MGKSRRLNRRQFVSTAAATAGVALLPGLRMSAMSVQDPATDSAATKGESRKRERAHWKVEPFSLNQVRLLDGPFKRQMDIKKGSTFQ